MARLIHLGFVYLCLLAMTGLSKTLTSEEDGMVIEVVKNGTVDAVVLDCPYDFEGEEEQVGLLIKWFRDDNPLAVYQWIPGHEPAAMGILAERVDLSFEVSQEENQKHRAIRILNPTTDVSGKYKCIASTFEDEKSITTKLVVYSPPANVHVWAEEEGEDEVKVVCEVEDVFPEAEVVFHMTSEDDDKRVALDGAQIVKSWEKGFYHFKLELVLEEDTLDGPTHFECEVTIPDTQVQVLNKTHYEPRVHERAGAVMSGSESRSAMTVGVSLAFLAIWRF